MKVIFKYQGNYTNLKLIVYDNGNNTSLYKFHRIKDDKIIEGKSCKSSYLKDKNLGLMKNVPIFTIKNYQDKKMCIS